MVSKRESVKHTDALDCFGCTVALRSGQLSSSSMSCISFCSRLFPSFRTSQLCVLYAYLAFSFQSLLPSFRCFVFPSPSSISPHIGFIPLWSFLLVTVIFCTATGDTNDRKLEELGEMQMPVTVQATTTQLWAVVWGPTQPPEDETHHFLSSMETESRKMTTSEDLSHHRGQPANQTQQPTTGEEERKDTEEQETQEGLYGWFLVWRRNCQQTMGSCCFFMAVNLRLRRV